MSPLFGYRVEQGFDATKEQRRDRVKWALLGMLLICGVYLFSGQPFAVELFQGCIATGLLYGENFYVQQRDHFGEDWLWKAFGASLPVHAIYLAAMFWTDAAFPSLMKKAIVFMPVLAVGFAIESILVDRVVKFLKPAEDQ